MSLRAFFILAGLLAPLPASAEITPTANSNAALSAMASGSANQVLRLGYAAAGDSPPVVYKPSPSSCPLNAGAGDGGSEIPTSDGKCWLAQFGGSVDFSDFGGSVTADADAPFANWIAALEAANLPGTVAQAKTYVFRNPVVFDVSPVKRSGLRIQGGGCNATRFAYTGSSSPAFRIGADTAGAVAEVSVAGGAASGGSGYVDGSYPDVALTGGTGTGAIGTVVVSGGAVKGVSISKGGAGYRVGTCSAPPRQPWRKGTRARRAGERRQFLHCPSKVSRSKERRRPARAMGPRRHARHDQWRRKRQLREQRQQGSRAPSNCGSTRW